VKLPTKDGDILLDYSKNLINDDVLKLLFDLVSILSSYISMCFFSFDLYFVFMYKYLREPFHFVFVFVVS